MRPNTRRLLLTVIVFCALLGLVVGIAAALLKPERGDLLALTGFLFLCGGVTLILSVKRRLGLVLAVGRTESVRIWWPMTRSS